MILNEARYKNGCLGLGAGVVIAGYENRILYPESFFRSCNYPDAFAESALGLTKSVGDLAGPCLFAITMGIARVLYGKFGDKIDLTKFMQVSGVLCVLSYLFVGLSAMPILGLIGCIICGFLVGIMWPGSISITVPRIPKGGTALFALLAVAGDMGGALGPSMVGYFS